MNQNVRGFVTVVLAACVAMPGAVSATNGYFSHGWGTKSKAMAGVATALPQDTLVAATNPAGMAFIGNRLDVGVAAFSPIPRGYEANNDFSTNAMGFPTGPFVTPGEFDSDDGWFLIPSFGYNYELNSDSTIGVSIYGNGGMNTKYTDRPPFENFAAYPNQLAVPAGTQPPPESGLVASPTGLLFQITPQGPVPYTGPANAPNNANPNGVFSATTPTSVNLEQLFIEVSYTLKFGDGKQSVGIAPVFAVQSFEAKGLEPFEQLSVDPENVTNNGKDWSYGVGLHFGWYGELTDRLALGASYRTTVWMTDFDKYKGLFAEGHGGNFDVPAMFNLGLAYKAQPNLTVAFDYQHIFYEETHAIANSNDVDVTQCFMANPKPAFCLGGQDGLGFGWNSMDVFKLGLKYDANERLTLLGGVSYATDLLNTNFQALFNVLAPATIQWHITAGASYRLNNKDTFDLAVAYMPKHTIDGESPSLTQAQTGSIYMEQKEIQVSWSHHF
jgi:long-chain fatty acid transport protein